MMYNFAVLPFDGRGIVRGRRGERQRTLGIWIVADMILQPFDCDVKAIDHIFPFWYYVSHF